MAGAALWGRHAGGPDDLEMVLCQLAQTFGHPLGVGLISSLGSRIRMASAPIGLFADLSEVNRLQGRGLLLAGAAFSLPLHRPLILQHDSDISANVLSLAAIALAAAILLRHRDLVVRFGRLVVVGGVALLGTSLLFDKVQEPLPNADGSGQLFERG